MSGPTIRDIWKGTDERVRDRDREKDGHRERKRERDKINPNISTRWWEDLPIAKDERDWCVRDRERRTERERERERERESK